MGVSNATQNPSFLTTAPSLEAGFITAAPEDEGEDEEETKVWSILSFLHHKREAVIEPWLLSLPFCVWDADSWPVKPNPNPAALLCTGGVEGVLKGVNSHLQPATLYQL